MPNNLHNELPDNAKIMTMKGDILVSTVRPNRGAVAILEHDRLLVSGAFTVLREKTNYPKEVLQVLLRTNMSKATPPSVYSRKQCRGEYAGREPTV